MMMHPSVYAADVLNFATEFLARTGLSGAAGSRALANSLALQGAEWPPLEQSRISDFEELLKPNTLDPTQSPVIPHS